MARSMISATKALTFSPRNFARLRTASVLCFMESAHNALLSGNVFSYSNSFKNKILQFFQEDFALYRVSTKRVGSVKLMREVSTNTNSVARFL